MRDRELSYWVSRGEDKAGFYVAEVDGEVAGTVCYVIGEDGEMEMNRMSTHKRFRGRGVATRLLLKIEETARRFHCSKVKFTTSANQEPAIALYKKNGYNLVCFVFKNPPLNEFFIQDQISYRPPVLSLVKILHFSKRIGT